MGSMYRAWGYEIWDHVSRGNELGSMYRGVARWGKMHRGVTRLGMKVSLGHEMGSMHRKLTRYGINKSLMYHKATRYGTAYIVR